MDGALILLGDAGIGHLGGEIDAAALFPQGKGRYRAAGEQKAADGLNNPRDSLVPVPDQRQRGVGNAQRQRAEEQGQDAAPIHDLFL